MLKDPLHGSFSKERGGGTVRAKNNPLVMAHILWLSLEHSFIPKGMTERKIHAICQQEQLILRCLSNFRDLRHFTCSSCFAEYRCFNLLYIPSDCSVSASVRAMPQCFTQVVDQKVMLHADLVWPAWIRFDKGSWALDQMHNSLILESRHWLGHINC